MTQAKPPIESAVRDFLEEMLPTGPTNRLRELRVALAIVSQEAQYLREEITSELKRLGLATTDVERD